MRTRTSGRPAKFQRLKYWCRREELNLWPHPYQGCALPLSYGGTWARTLPPASGEGKGQVTSYPCLDLAIFAPQSVLVMAPDDTKRPETQQPDPSDQGRRARLDKDARLAEALRRNLAERKRQQRGRKLPDKKTPREGGA